MTLSEKILHVVELLTQAQDELADITETMYASALEAQRTTVAARLRICQLDIIALNASVGALSAGARTIREALPC